MTKEELLQMIEDAPDDAIVSIGIGDGDLEDATWVDVNEYEDSPYTQLTIRA